MAGFRFVSWHPPSHTLLLLLVSVTVLVVDEIPCTNRERPCNQHIACTALGLLAFVTILRSQTLACAAHSTKDPARAD